MTQGATILLAVMEDVLCGRKRVVPARHIRQPSLDLGSVDMDKHVCDIEILGGGRDRHILRRQRVDAGVEVMDVGVAGIPTGQIETFGQLDVDAPRDFNGLLKHFIFKPSADAQPCAAARQLDLKWSPGVKEVSLSRGGHVMPSSEGRIATAVGGHDRNTRWAI